MSDNKNIANGRDRKHIALGEDYEVRYWAGKLGVSKEELEQAVAAVGNEPEKVEAYLHARRRH